MSRLIFISCVKTRVILNNGNLLNSQSLFLKQIEKNGWKMLAGYNVYFKKLYIGDIFNLSFQNYHLTIARWCGQACINIIHINICQSAIKQNT